MSSRDEIPTDPGSRKRKFKRMLSNIKLPHWAMALLGAIAMILPWALKQESAGVFQVPSWIIPVENGILALLVYLGFASPSVSPQTNATAMAKYAAKKVAPVVILLGSLYFLEVYTSLVRQPAFRVLRQWDRQSRLPYAFSHKPLRMWLQAKPGKRPLQT